MIRIKCNWGPASSSNSGRRVREKILPAVFPSRIRSQNESLSLATAAETAVRIAQLIRCKSQVAIRKSEILCGVLAQLVERLNGIEEVRGSNPLGSTISVLH